MAIKTAGIIAIVIGGLFCLFMVVFTITAIQPLLVLSPIKQNARPLAVDLK